MTAPKRDAAEEAVIEEGAERATVADHDAALEAAASQPAIPGDPSPTGSAPVTEEIAPRAASGVRRGRFDRSIVEGPLAPAVWRIAWPTMLGNIIGGVQGIIDHAMVGHYVG